MAKKHQIRRLVGILVAAGLLSASGRVMATEPDWEAVWQFCKKDALNQLELSTTAKFDYITLLSREPPRLSIYFSVDSQNSSGALVRLWAHCMVTPDAPSGGTVFLDVFKKPVLMFAADPALQHLPPE